MNHHRHHVLGWNLLQRNLGTKKINLTNHKESRRVFLFGYGSDDQDSYNHALSLSLLPEKKVRLGFGFL